MFTCLKKFRFVAGSALAALGLMAAPVAAQEVFNDDYGDVYEYEYDWGAYDYDGDSTLDEDEWYDYSYDTIDYNDDELIDENEWNDYTANWYEPYNFDYGYDFADYDVDNDGYWTEEEYTSAYDTADTGLFDVWDEDDSGYIDTDEFDTVWNNYGVDYGAGEDIGAYDY